MATIVDVAKLAGVSTATVSRVFNGQVVSDERVRAVRSAAHELQYVPNRTARSLRRRHSEMIALIFPDVSNPYFTEIARGVEDVARAAGYSVVLCNTDGDHAQESEYLRVAAAANMAGVIIAAADDESPAPPEGSGPAVVAIDRALRGANVDEIVMDNYEAGFLAARYICARSAANSAASSPPVPARISRIADRSWCSPDPKPSARRAIAREAQSMRGPWT